ncbi:hypothetical protein CYMTET_37194 [Cymbomonas tetramitiformis]|uniref:DUF659 domain-containing protein n=1 Tax=Cymbomonas tetramitiformis TaxID=36881 RepID=A0AAE0CEG7_9CHLO|nr:hypothetical protein CYMTET_37194 [Cymbomonas tetramitiformis]
MASASSPQGDESSPCTQPEVDWKGTKPTVKDSVRTILTSKYDPAFCTNIAYNRINPGKLLVKVFKNQNVHEDVKLKLATVSKAECAVVFKKQYDLKRKSCEDSNSDALKAIENECLEEEDPSVFKENARQSILDARSVDVLSEGEAAVLNFYLACFFFICRIPFNCVENPFFKRFISAVRPAYTKFLPSRRVLSSTCLDDVYEETLDTTEALLNRVPGKETLGLDGHTNVRGRGTVNFIRMKQTISTYVKTIFCKSREHTTAFHAELVQAELEDRADKFMAVVADNTGNMKAMFSILQKIFTALFFIGCRVHVLDLLIEDIAKIEVIADTVTDFHFISSFMRRHGLLTEAVMQKAAQVFGNKTRSFRVFPLTRFAYCYLMVNICLYNWPVLIDVPKMPEYRLVKAKAMSRKKKDGTSCGADFLKFESLLKGDIKTRGEGVHDLLRPISSALHFLEGGSIPPSYILPVYCMLYWHLVNPPSQSKDILDVDSLDCLKRIGRERWLGTSEKVGLRHNLHCATFMLDPYVRAAVKTVLGDEQFKRLERSFNENNVLAVFKNYCGGKSDSKYARIVAEYNRFIAQDGGYKQKLKNVNMLVKLQLGDVLKEVEDEDKDNKLLVLVHVLRSLRSIGTGVIFWQGLDVDSAEQELLAVASVDMLQAVMHAIGVERSNKNCGLVHSKLRANLGESRTVKAVYVYSNLSLTLPKDMSKQKKKGAVAQLLEEVMEEDELSTLLSSFDFADGEEAVLPAGEAETESDSEEEDDAEDAEGAGEDGPIDELFVMPHGFTAVDKPAALPREVDNLYVMMVWAMKDRRNRVWNAWEVGKVEKYMHNRTLHNYNILWDDGLRGSKLHLSAYYTMLNDETYIPQAGEWLFLRKSLA